VKKLRSLLFAGLFLLAFAAIPASASALCNGMAATVGGATAGPDTLTGTGGADVIEGLGGNDTINGGGGNDTICGDDGDDTVNGEAGDDHLEGGTTGETAGDTVTFVGINGITANLSTGVATTFPLQTDSMTGFENLTGTNTFDSLTGDGGANVIRGLNAADLFEGLGGDDTLIDDVGGVADQDTAKYSTATGGVTGSLATGTVNGAGVGTDTLTGFRGLYGSNFNDVLVGDNDNQLSNATDNDLEGLGGNDVLEPLRGTDTVIGGGGVDLVTYANDIAIEIDLSIDGLPNATTTPVDEVDSVSEVENVTGSPENDTITGDGNSNVLNGGAGADQLNGGSGGSDTASFAGASAGVVANLVAGTATGAGSDTLTNIDNLTGSDQDDLLTGDIQDNVLNGGIAGNDTALFNGLAVAVNANLALGTAVNQGSDTLFNVDNLTGSTQADTLTGNEEPNVLSGLDGADNLTGGLGADGLFLGAGADVIAANDGVPDIIDCEGGGPDSGSVDGPAPAETYTACDTDGDAVVDFLDACPTTSGTGTDGCVPAVATPPQAQPVPTTPAKKKCKKKKKHRAAAAKKCKKRK
jgi:Ca2+-binding RTX toxin-like protein